MIQWNRPYVLLHSVPCCYNTVWHNTRLNTALLWLRQNITHILNSQNTPHMSHSRVSHGGLLGVFWRHSTVMMVAHCTYFVDHTLCADTIVCLSLIWPALLRSPHSKWICQSTPCLFISLWPVWHCGETIPQFQERLGLKNIFFHTSQIFSWVHTILTENIKWRITET